MPTTIEPGALRALLIPADETQPSEIVLAASAELAKAIGAEWFELVHHPWLSERGMVMVVDEEGLLNGAAPNRRATEFYPYGAGIRGDAMVVAEVEDEDGERDLGSLSPFQVGALVSVLPAAVVGA